jgi:hypothetical protein
MILVMKQNSELIVKKTTLISRRIFWSFMGLFFFAGVLSAFAEPFDLKWLKIIVAFVGGISLILLVISWAAPGIFILLRIPWLSHAWLRGINSRIPTKPWEQMSIGEKFLIYLFSISIFVVVVLGIVVTILFYL